MNAMKGTQSIAFSESPYLVSAGSVAGKKEGEGPLGKYFDIASEDDLFGEKTWELAEGTMQKLACKLALKNAGRKASNACSLLLPIFFARSSTSADI